MSLSTKKTLSCGLLLVSIGLILSSSGCVIGNKEVDPPGPGAIQGNYETLISPSINICATRPVLQSNGSTQQQTNCVPTASKNADFAFTEEITNPVFLEFNSTSGQFALVPTNISNPGPGLPILSDNAGNLFASFSITGFFPLMQTHPNCTFSLSYSAQGTYGEPNGPFTSGTTLPLSGRIAMNLDWNYQPVGPDCALLANCYNSATACSAQDQEFVEQEFGAFINAGILKTTDLPNVQNLEYQVSYQ